MRRVSTGWCCILSKKWYTTKLSLEEAPALQSKPNQSRPKHFIGKDWDDIKVNLCTAVAKLSKVESRTKPMRGSLHLVNIWKTKNLNVVIFSELSACTSRTPPESLSEKPNVKFFTVDPFFWGMSYVGHILLNLGVPLSKVLSYKMLAHWVKVIWAKDGPTIFFSEKNPPVWNKWQARVYDAIKQSLKRILSIYQG